MKFNGGSVPRVSIWNRQRLIRLDLDGLEVLAGAAVPLCLDQAGGGCPVLHELEEVEVALVSDRVIAQVHRRFMNIPGATDVITFEHGEIVVSVTTAQREALARMEPVSREALRYIVHGLLHLNGHEDAQKEEAAAMWQAQEEVMMRLWPLKRSQGANCW